MDKYIYEYPQWPHFTWDEKAIQVDFGQVRHLQGRISGLMNSLGFSDKTEASLKTLTLDVVKSSEIEGEILNYDQVRSSIARRLGINSAGLVASHRSVDGVVEMMLDATQNYNKILTHERLYAWHAALFPTGYSGLYKIEVGHYRSHEMQIVSGAFGKEQIHYQAIAPCLITQEMNDFIVWFNSEDKLDPVLKAALAHFWFIIIHPFDDGNGRIARALTDLLLARAEQSPERFYSISNQMLIERKNYYSVLQSVQHSSSDISEWVNWFLSCLKNALISTEANLKQIILKAQFWDAHSHISFNERQRKMLNKLFDGFEGKLQTSKWAKMAQCSADTALRDIKDLVEKDILKIAEQSGRNTNYELKIQHSL